MSGRDRSAEFSAAIRLLQGGSGPGTGIGIGSGAPLLPGVRHRGPGSTPNSALALANGGRARAGAGALQSHSQFMETVRIISNNIAVTYTKLDHLTALAKKKSLFDDNLIEIQKLTYEIKEDLGSLNNQIARLGELPRGRKNLQSHSSGVVLALQSRLASMSAHYKQVLEVRSENLKHRDSRRERFTEGLPPVRGTSALLEEDYGVPEAEGFAGSDRAHLAQRMALRDESDAYVAQRAETMHNIESTIVELGAIFQQLAHMVKEQDETIGRIDTNIQDTELNVEAAHSQILKYFQSVTGNRALMFKIFGILIFFFIFFVVFLA